MGTTNFRNSFPGGVTLRGVQVHASSALGKIAGGKVFFVSSVTGSDGNAGTDATKPFATLAKAVSMCRANKGDVIYLMAKHVETVATAGAIDLNIAGITVIGLGEGADRPTFTFSTTASTITLTAASTTVRGVISKPSVDAVVSPFVISAPDWELDIEHQDASATVEAERAVLTTAAADRGKLNLKYLGFATGNACVNAVRLVGGNDIQVNVDFHGVASTGVVEFITTASTNVTINAYTFNSGTTDGSKNVINTGGLACTWYAVIDDGAAGARYTGGSASALASDDVSAIASALLVPTADATTNTNERDVIGNKTDAAVSVVGTTKTIIAYVKGLIGLHAAGTTDAATATFARDVIGNKSDAAVTTVGTASSIMAYLKGLANGGTGAGTTFWISKTLISSNIVTATPPDITGVSSGGDLAIRDLIIQSDATGLAGMTALTVATNNVKGVLIFFQTAITALGANGTVDMANASVTKIHTILESGKKLTANRTVADGTGAGTITVYVRFERLTAGATIAAA